MKKKILTISLIFSCVFCMAQKKSPFPFRGGKEHMMQFFKDSAVVTPDILREKATGTVVFKFTADELGNITKMVVFYADDATLVEPVIAVLKKSNHMWVLPDNIKADDFLITFSFNFNAPATNIAETRKEAYNFITRRKPLLFDNQAVLDLTTLLPTIVINYDIQSNQ